VPRGPSFLQRFRRIIAPPGPPVDAVGVPASGEELEGELGPLLDQLDAVDADASEIEAQAREQAARRRDEAAREAAAILAEAQVRADAVHARAASERRMAAQPRITAASTEAESQARRIAAVREQRIERLVGEVLECVRRSGV
jgi:hypothetical protein